MTRGPPETGSVATDRFCWTGPNGEYDWILMDPDIDFAGLAARFDIHLIGRKSFEAMQTMQDAPPSAGDVREIVLSRTLEPAAHPNAEIARDAVELVRR